MTDEQAAEISNTNGETAGEGPPSNSELNMRLVRIEEQQSHMVETLDRVETRLNEDLKHQQETLDELQPQHVRLWLLYQAGKWLILALSGGGVLALAVEGVA